MPARTDGRTCVRTYVRTCVRTDGRTYAYLHTYIRRLDMRKYSLSQRVINEWNKLPNDRVNASSVNMFKNIIDRYLIKAGYT